MGFFSQLWLLTWKNVTVQRRQKVRLIVELLWPALLFVVIAFVRRSQSPVVNGECHYGSKALPSGGLLPFFQSILCDFEGKCYSNETYSEGKGNVNNFHDAGLTKLVEDMEKIMTNETTMRALRTLLTELDELNKILPYIQSPDNFLNVFPGQLLPTALISKTALAEFMQQQLNTSQDNAQLVAETSSNTEMVVLLLSGHYMRSIVCNTTQLKGYITSTDPAEIEAISETLCNMSDANLDKLSNEVRRLIIEGQTNVVLRYSHVPALLVSMTQQITELQSFNDLAKDIANITATNDTDQLVCGNMGTILDVSNFQLSSGSEMFGESANVQGVVTEPNTQPLSELKQKRSTNSATRNQTEDLENLIVPREDCDWIKQINSTTIGHLIWERLKPMIQGYILYVPDTKATKRIMTETERPFASIRLARKLAERYLQVSTLLQNYILNNPGFAVLNVLRENPELVEELQQLSRVNSTAGYFRLVEIMEDVRNTPVNDSITGPWLGAIQTIDDFANQTLAVLQCVNLDKVKGYQSQEEFQDAAKMLQGQQLFWGGVIFQDFDDSPDNDTIPPHVKYELRMDSSMVRFTGSSTSRYWYPGPTHNIVVYGEYLVGGFVFLQDMLEQGIIKASLRLRDSGAGLYIQEFPYPCYVSDSFLNANGLILPLCMVIAWIFSVSMVIKNIVLEKELRLKEVMKVMGLSNAVHRLAWFINSFVVMFISTCSMVLVIKVGKILINTDATTLIFMLMSFSMSTISLCFLISAFFSKANLAAACGAVIFFATYVPYSLAFAFDAFLPLPAKFALCLSNTIAFGYSCQYLSMLEIQSSGAQWSTLTVTPISTGEPFTLLQLMGMLWFDTALYMILTWYIEAVAPGTYGIPRPFYFPFQRSYWCDSQTTEDVDSDVLKSDNDIQTENSDFEKEPAHLKLGASICNLYKIYKTGKKLAVNNLSINFYEGQITSFLGHNGAGKTTTMSILTGLFPPTNGTAYIYGKNILTDISAVRKSLGMCPQHNVLFDNLTVAEHLWFFARLKGAKRKDIAVEMEEMLKHLHLEHKRNEMVDSLSGGMKRKLSIAMAFMAGSKMVILDEPTAGVDPYARREIWELLGNYKEGRTIIMSTHHMDEADVLGDRIAIISTGQLRCSGSSLFLKSRFGAGYYLVLNKRMPGDAVQVSPNLTDPTVDTHGALNAIGPAMLDPDLVPIEEKKKDGDLDFVEGAKMKVAIDDNDPPPKKYKPPIDIPDSGSCQESTVTRFIQSYIPGATLCENLGTELSYILPSAATQQGTLEYLFHDLDIFKDQLYVANFGISDTSLEEVFLSVTDDSGIIPLGETLQGTDEGLLPRPFMGRGSLKRRSYKLPARTNSIRERRSRSIRSQRGEDSAKEIDVEQQDNNTTALNTCENPRQNPDKTDNPQESSTMSRGSVRQGDQQTSVPMQRQISRQISRQLLRQASHLEVETQETDVSVGSVRTPDAESCQSRAADLSGKEVHGLNLIRRQFYALMVKRFHHFRRSIKGFIAQVILPVLFVSLGLLFSIIVPAANNTNELPLVPWLTGTPNYIFYSNDYPESGLAAGMEDSITNDNPGICTRCMQDNPFDKYPCQPEVATDWSETPMDPKLYEEFLRGELNCQCSGTGLEVCDKGAEGPRPPKRMVPTTDYLEDYTDTNISWYIKSTLFDYVWKRFGGVSFLETDNLAPLTMNISERVLRYWVGREPHPTNWPDFQLPAEMDEIMKILPLDDTMRDIYTIMLSVGRFQNIKVWWNNNGYHALPAFINVANNMLFRGNIEKSERSRYGITAYNHPINLTQEQIQETVLRQTPVIMTTAVFIVFALAFVPASFVVFLVTERESKSKHLQIVSGISPTVYWVATFVWDLTNFLLPVMLIMVVFLCFNQQAFIGPNNALATLLLLLFYGWAITPLTYPASYVFSAPSTAYLSVACLTTLTGILTMMSTFILEFLGQNDQSLLSTNEALKKFFLIFPPFCLGRGLADMALISLTADLTGQIGLETKVVNSLEWEVVGRNIFSLAISGIVSFTMTLLIEKKFFFKPRHIETQHMSVALEDDDVAKERHRVLSGAANDDIVRIENLTKDYSTRNGVFTAVDKMCVGIPYGECFGLLGVNGAGKTTTFKMLTGDTQVTSGSAYVKGFSILKEINQVRQNIGYCPQFDALNDLLTAEEHLAFYARLKGVPEADIDKVVQWAIKKLGLTMYAKRVAGTYSGGNKRKLSTAIALIGDPQLVFLDEPTAGMDPKARRFLWNQITSIIKEGRSVILTSHSMEECEALCTRVAIMVNGRFKCLGSTQHLKSKFGNGYTITIRVGGDPPLMEPLMVFIAETFPNTILREHHFNMLEYQIPTFSTSLARMFAIIDTNMQRFCIEDYSISQTTLDQVFINFAKEQTTGSEDTKHPEKTALGVAIFNVSNGNIPEDNQMTLPPDMCTLQFAPENSTVGGFAFAAASVFGGVIHHDDQKESSVPTMPPDLPTRQDSTVVTNVMYEFPQNGTKPRSDSNVSQRTKKSKRRKRHTVHEFENEMEEVVDDCLIPSQNANVRLVSISHLNKVFPTDTSTTSYPTAFTEETHL